jgi:uracil phosphoribosyltransferase
MSPFASGSILSGKLALGCVYSSDVPVHLVQHPIAQDALSSLRDRTTPASEFRRLAHRLSLILAIEATRKLPMGLARIETPLEAAEGEILDANVVVVPVLRAGLGMVEAILTMLPNARVGHIGLQRDEQTAIASRYYLRLPRDLSNATALVVDPMLATGGSALAAIELLEQAGAHDIRLVCIVAAPEGIAAVEAAHPAVPIFTPVIDRELNAQKFILPGLGDFGDRLYGTV